MKPTKKLILSLASMLAITSTTFGDWTVVSSFDDDSALDLITDQESLAESGAHSAIVDGMWALYPGDLFETTTNLWSTLDMGADLTTASGLVTVYMEIVQPTINGSKAIIDTVVGLSNEDEAEILTVRYDSYNVMARVDSVSDEFQGRNGSVAYVTVTTFEPDVKYSVWYVIDYALGYYQLYIQGGTFTEPTEMSQGGWLFRKDPVAGTSTVDKFLVSLSRGNSVDGAKGIDPTFLDNIAYDMSGQNLTVPGVTSTKGPGALGNYDINTDGDVNTGDWLGWLRATPNYPWVYSYGLQSWVYFGTSDKDAGGAWVYARK